MGITDRLTKGLSSAYEWTKEKVEAGAKLVEEAVTDVKDAAIEKLAKIVPAADTVKKTVDNKATSILGINNFSEKVSYAWKKTTEMTSTLATVASVVFPSVGIARSIVNVGNNTFKVLGSNDTVKILDKNESATSILKSDSTWSAAIKRQAAQNEGESARLDTEKVLSNLPRESSDDGSQIENKEVTRHVRVDEWKQIIAQSEGVPTASTDGDGITFHGEGDKSLGKNSADQLRKKNKLEVSAKEAKRTSETGTEVTVSREGKNFKSNNKGNGIEIDRETGEKKALFGGKQVYGENSKGVREWAIHDDQKVVFDPKEQVYSVFDKAGNLLGKYSKSQIDDGVEDQIDERTWVRRWSKRKLDQVLSRRQEQGEEKKPGRLIGAAEDGLFMEDTDGTVVVLMFDGNAYFQLDAETRIWKNKENKYFLVQKGKEPQPIEEGKETEQLKQETQKYLDILKQLAQNGHILIDGIEFSLENGVASATVQQKGTPAPAAKVIASSSQSTVETATIRSTLKDNKVIVGPEGKETIIDLLNDVVDTPFVITDKKGTTIKATGDWMGHDGTAKLADGTEYKANGDVHFADGTVIRHDGTIEAGDKTRLEAYIQEKEIKQAAVVIQEANSIAGKARAKASAGTVTQAVLTQLDGSITQVMGLMSAFSDNDLVLAQLSKLIISLEGARNEARSSFQQTTQLRVMREAALASGNEKAVPESLKTESLRSTYQPTLSLESRFQTGLRLSA